MILLIKKNGEFKQNKAGAGRSGIYPGFALGELPACKTVWCCMDQKLKDTPVNTPASEEEKRRREGLSVRGVLIAAGLVLAFVLFFLNVILKGGA